MKDSNVFKCSLVHLLRPHKVQTGMLFRQPMLQMTVVFWLAVYGRPYNAVFMMIFVSVNINLIGSDDEWLICIVVNINNQLQIGLRYIRIILQNPCWLLFHDFKMCGNARFACEDELTLWLNDNKWNYFWKCLYV